MKSLKICVILAFSVSLGTFFLLEAPRGVGKSELSIGENARTLLSAGPDIERFDSVVQKRFLTEPNFGIRRMEPDTPEPLESAHVRSFRPKEGEESTLVDAFTNGGWQVGLYLFGRTARPDERKKDPFKKFDIRYRLNQPVPVTPELKVNDLPGPKRIIEEVKEAFLTFQRAQDTSAQITFTKDYWTFVARPVRAVNDSCIRCHTDYVITEKLDEGKFKFRKRAVGDVNGVIVYGYTRKAN